jgi:N-acetyl-alpha-D-muramate 1-phosphate uridylyltransferase
MEGRLLAQLWMVPNPAQHPGGDFGIDAGLATPGQSGSRRTWSGVGLFTPGFVTELMADLPLGERAPLRPYLDRAIAQQRLGALAFDSLWADVGTPERLQALQTH